MLQVCKGTFPVWMVWWRRGQRLGMLMQSKYKVHGFKSRSRDARDIRFVTELTIYFFFKTGFSNLSLFSPLTKCNITWGGGNALWNKATYFPFPPAPPIVLVIVVAFCLLLRSHLPYLHQTFCVIYSQHPKDVRKSGASEREKKKEERRRGRYCVAWPQLTFVCHLFCLVWFLREFCFNQLVHRWT